jgi:hypothetical protein
MAIAIIKEDRFPVIAPARDMIDRTGILNEHLAQHRSIVTQKPHRGKCNTGQIYGLTPLMV